MMEILKLNQVGLKDFIDSGAFESYDFLSITKHRAYSQLQNPLAKEDDILLFLAMEDHRLAGYLGCLPDELVSEDKTHHFAWLSTLFVSPDFRGKKIAQKLLNEAFASYNNKIFITEFTPEAEALYNKIKAFIYIEPKIGWRYYFRFDLEDLLPRKKPVFSKLKLGLKAADKVGNTLVDIKNKVWKKQDSQYRLTSEWSSELQNFVTQQAGQKMKDRLDWIVNNPWLLHGSADQRYLFSSFTHAFDYSFIVIYDKENVLKALLMVSVRNGHLKILYRFGTPPQRHDFTEAVHWFVVKYKINMLTCYSDVLNFDFITGDVGQLLKRPMERRYMVHKEFK